MGTEAGHYSREVAMLLKASVDRRTELKVAE